MKMCVLVNCRKTTLHKPTFVSLLFSPCRLKKSVYFNSISHRLTFHTPQRQLQPPSLTYAPEMVGVLGGHAHPQRIQDALGVAEAERGRWQFLSHCLGLREKERLLSPFCAGNQKSVHNFDGLQRLGFTFG